MNQNPKISVLLAVHNGEKYIKQAVLSVLTQTYKNYELIVCANGCTDKTLEIIYEIQREYEPNICILKLPDANKSKALNEMMPIASGEFIAIQDADDVWTMEKLKIQVQQTNNFDVIGGLVKYIDADGDDIPLEFDVAFLHEKIAEQMKDGDNSIANCTALIRKSIINEVGGWDPKYEGIEDFELWLRMLTHSEAKFTNVKKMLAWHRLHETSHFNSKDQIENVNRLKAQYKLNP